jgi:hypothetical protein
LDINLVWAIATFFAVQAHNEAVAQWNKSATRNLLADNPAPELGPAFYAARSRYVGARQRATAVASRLAAEGVNGLAHDAIASIADYRDNWSKTDKPHGVSRWTRANEATEEALFELGALISNPPARPERQSGWRPFGRIKKS